MRDRGRVSQGKKPGLLQVCCKTIHSPTGPFAFSSDGDIISALSHKGGHYKNRKPSITIEIEKMELGSRIAAPQD